ncbi:MAG: hypothetical protein M3458_18025 [Acidobacteriota bacterium]|nr:hypothetical protein [Acidobacteriota bacterium]
MLVRLAIILVVLAATCVAFGDAGVETLLLFGRQHGANTRARSLTDNVVAGARFGAEDADGAHQ